MAVFQNFATLSYNGITTSSNVVTGEIVETVSVNKTSLVGDYTANGDVTYVISLVNSGSTPVSALTVTDDLGGYAFGDETVYPLNVIADSVRYYVNGVLQPTPTVTAGPPLTVSPVSIPAGGNAIIVYEATVTPFAPLGDGDTVTNTVNVDGDGLNVPVTATETVTARNEVSLSISKALSPATVEENGQITYTFVIENTGNTETAATDDVILSDTFDPVLSDITVVYNGTVWTEGVNYTYDEATGVFSTLAGQITVPAAQYTRNEDGTFTVSPGTAVITVSGTV